MRTDHPAYEIIGKELGSDTRVLDVGCGDGTIGELLSSGGATIDGIEPVESSAAKAEHRIHYVSRATLNDALDDPLLEGDYDVVLCLDVLEHFVDPAEALAHASRFLSPSGVLFTLIPNSGHWSFRRKMLRGDWSYDKWGLFDRTHLRFFDLRTATELCRESNMSVVRCDHLMPKETRVPGFACRLWPSLFALHFLFELRREPAEPAGS